jgi:competence protein ComEC
LQRQIGPTSVSGQVARAEIFPDGAHLTLERVRIGGLGPEATPERIRIRLRRNSADILAGDWVRMRARVGPPPPPVMPGAFDFQRHLFFAGIGGTGFAFGSAKNSMPVAGRAPPMGASASVSAGSASGNDYRCVSVPPSAVTPAPWRRR